MGERLPVSVPDPLGQRHDGDLLAVADVEDLARPRAARPPSASSAPTTSRDVAEAARLRAVAVHGDRLARQRLPHEVRDHHAVAAGLARPHGVEEAHDDRPAASVSFQYASARNSSIALLQAYAQRCFGVGPSTRSASSLEGHVGALAVHLGGRRDDDQLLLLVRVLEHDLGAVHVGLDRVDRLLDDQLHADGRGEVEHDVAVVDQLGEQRLVRDLSMA